MNDWTVYQGDCLDVLPTLPAASVQCVVTSPPYFGLRDYGQDQQIGLEATPAEYVAKLVQVFREVRRVLRDDGVVWLNLGDSYAGGKQGRDDGDRGQRHTDGRNPNTQNEWKGPPGKQRKPPEGLDGKSLLGIPWRVAFALQDDGWLLRSDVVWAKPNPMPESVKDRPTKSHEYVFLLAKQGRYWYDVDAVREESVDPESYTGRRKRHSLALPNHDPGYDGHRTAVELLKLDGNTYPRRNRRSVWTVATSPFTARKYGFECDHFAVMPPKLVEPCVLAGCPVGGVVLDPFCGAGTTGRVAVQHGRRFIGIELNPDYVAIAHAHIADGAKQPRLHLEAS